MDVAVSVAFIRTSDAESLVSIDLVQAIALQLEFAYHAALTLFEDFICKIPQEQKVERRTLYYRILREVGTWRGKPGKGWWRSGLGGGRHPSSPVTRGLSLSGRELRGPYGCVDGLCLFSARCLGGLLVCPDGAASCLVPLWGAMCCRFCVCCRESPAAHSSVTCAGWVAKIWSSSGGGYFCQCQRACEIVIYIAVCPLDTRRISASRRHEEASSSRRGSPRQRAWPPPLCGRRHRRAPSRTGLKKYAVETYSLLFLLSCSPRLAETLRPRWLSAGRFYQIILRLRVSGILTSRKGDAAALCGLSGFYIPTVI